MQKTMEHLPTEAARVLRRALPEGVDIRIRDHSAGTSIEMHLPASPVLVLDLRPSDAAKSQPALPDSIPIAVFRSLRDSDRDRLRNEGRSYIDLSGAVFIRAPGFFLDRSDLPPRPGQGRQARGVDPYADRASRVVRALLMAPRAQRWSTQGIATDAGVDTATASRVVRELRRRELVRDEAPGQGRKSSIWVPNPRALIGDWTRRYAWDDNSQIRVAAPVGSPRQFIVRMPKLMTGVRWALGLHAGASLLAPHAEFDLVHAYVDPEQRIDALAVQKGWEFSSSGKLCLLQPMYVESIWYQSRTVDRLPIVSPLQLVLDLWHYPVRGREQAQHLIDTILEPIWDADARSR